MRKLDLYEKLTSLTRCSLTVSFPRIKSCFQEAYVYNYTSVSKPSISSYAIEERVLNLIVQLAQRDEVSEYIVSLELSVVFQFLRPFGHVRVVLE